MRVPQPEPGTPAPGAAPLLGLRAAGGRGVGVKLRSFSPTLRRRIPPSVRSPAGPCLSPRRCLRRLQRGRDFANSPAPHRRRLCPGQAPAGLPCPARDRPRPRTPKGDGAAAAPAAPAAGAPLRGARPRAPGLPASERLPSGRGRGPAPAAGQWQRRRAAKGAGSEVAPPVPSAGPGTGRGILPRLGSSLGGPRWARLARARGAAAAAAEGSMCRPGGAGRPPAAAPHGR